MARRPWIKDRQTALVLGVGFVTAGALMLHDAYENRGVDRPFWTRLLPGA